MTFTSSDKNKNKKMKHPVTTLETVTPDLALKWLQGNTMNRPLSKPHVAFLTQELESGRWQINGDTICFNGSVLLDGQHRLHACVRANKPFQTLVVRGIRKESFETIDVNKKNRSVADILNIEGYKYHTHLGTAAIRMMRYEELGHMGSASRRYSSREILQFIEKNPDISTTTEEWASAIMKSRLMTAGGACGCITFFHRIDPSLTAEYCNAIFDGVGIEKGSIEQVVRRSLEKKFSKQGLPLMQSCAFLIKGWNAKREGQNPRSLAMVTKESFPKINGL